jgi:hypothetical protein
MAQETQAVSAPVKADPIKQLNSPVRHKLAEHDFVQHSVTVEAGHTIDDVLKPEYFAHVAAKFKPYDEISVRTDDGTWYAKLLVTEVGRSWLRTFLLEDYKLTTSDVAQSQANAVEVIWRGPHLKHSVVRKSDRGVLKDGFATKGEAAAWAAENA